MHEGKSITTIDAETAETAETFSFWEAIDDPPHPVSREPLHVEIDQ